MHCQAAPPRRQEHAAGPGSGQGHCCERARARLAGSREPRLRRRAGKSTLLDLVAGRKTVGELTGDVLYSGIRPTQAFLRRYTGARAARAGRL